MPRIAALVVAAGSGTRAGQSLPKQYVPVGGKPLLHYSLRAFLAHEAIDAVQTVIAHEHTELFKQAVKGLTGLLMPSFGGATRQASVLAGLRGLAERVSPDIVLIHDAARPFLPAEVIDRLIAALERHDGAIPALPVVDTIKQVDENGVIVATPPRPTLRAAQTPQAFHFDAILKAHLKAAERPDIEFSDDAAVAEQAGLRVVVVEGAAILRKVTHGEDFAWAEDMARRLKA